MDGAAEQMLLYGMEAEGFPEKTINTLRGAHLPESGSDGAHSRAQRSNEVLGIRGLPQACEITLVDHHDVCKLHLQPWNIHTTLYRAPCPSKDPNDAAIPAVGRLPAH